jgi:hypothetical protein
MLCPNGRQNAARQKKDIRKCVDFSDIKGQNHGI